MQSEIKNNDLSRYGLELPQDYHNNILKIHIFKLKDPEKGFAPENREILLETYHSIRNDTDVQQQDFKKCEPWIPLRLYNKNETFYENQYRTQSFLEQESSQSGVPKWLYAQDYSTMTPEEILDIFKNVSLEELIKRQTETDYNYINDQDYKYFPFIGEEFITREQRIQHEKEDPYAYIYFTVEQGTGCDHYWRKAFPICYDCKRLTQCRFCHEIEYHQMDKNKTQLMYCLLCGKIGPIGKYCIHCHKQVSQIFCPICKVLCNIGEDVKPAYHCDKCGCCRVGKKEQSIHCDKCKNCYDIGQKGKHVCYQQGYCMVCQENLSEAIEPEYQLKCSPNHRIHISCYEQLLKNGQIFCPLCHKIIIEDDQYFQIKGRVYKAYQQLPYYQRYKYQLMLYKCYDCGAISCDLYNTQDVTICHECYGINCQILEPQQELFIPYQKIIQNKEYKELTKLTSEDMNDLSKCIQHLLEWRSIHKKLCPQIKNRDIQKLLDQSFNIYDYQNIQFLLENMLFQLQSEEIQEEENFEDS